MKLFLTAAASAFLLAGPAHAASIFFEGFETPDIMQDWFVYDEFGQFDTVSGAGIEVQQSGTVVNAFEGNQYVELDSDFQVTANPGQGSNSAMATFLNLVAGRSYALTFAYQPRTNSLNDNGISVDVGVFTDGGQGARSFSVTNALGQVDGQSSDFVGASDAVDGWKVFKFVFEALDGDNALMFSANGNENELGGFIDAINVAETPAPAGFVLLASGLGLLATRRRRVKA
ncbi:MAG: hypothetical protein AAGG79_00070 [Pseudomonadota bacterium]